MRQILRKPINYNLLLLFFTLSILCSAQEWYEPSLKISNKTADTAQNIQTLRSLLVYYQRLSESEPQLWMPYYYQSYIYYKLADDRNEKVNKSENLKRALLIISLSRKSFMENIEVSALYILILNECLRSGIIQNSAENHKLIQEAMEPVSENPRMLIAQTHYLLSDTINNRKLLSALEPRLIAFHKDSARTFFENRHSPSWGFAETDYLLGKLKDLN